MIRNFENGDIVTSGNKQFLYGQESTANGLYHRLRMFLGEFFLDVSDGTPWFQSILGKTPQDVAEINVKQRILTSPDVVGITSFTFGSDANARRVDIQASVIDKNSAVVQLLFGEDII
jgi:hypothetical protein